MKYRIMRANLPHVSPILVEPRNSQDFWLVIENPFSEDSRRTMSIMVAEFGANSESYLKYHRTIPSKYRGTGSGAIAVDNYIRPYCINPNYEVVTNPDNGNAVEGFFFKQSIQMAVLTKLQQLGAVDVNNAYHENHNTRIAPK